MRWTLALLALGTAACGPDFTPQDEIDRLRVLGIRSEVVGADNRAWPGVVEDARLSALVTDDELDADTDPARFEYRWRVCPVAFGSEADFACVFDEETFEELIISSLPPDLPLPIPPEDLIDVSFDLGTSTTAVFNLRDVFFASGAPVGDDVLEPVLEEILEATCEQLRSAEFPDFVERPTCNGTFALRIDLTVCDLPGEQCSPESVPSGSDGPPDVVQTVRFLEVIYEDALVPNPNRNPEITVLCRARTEFDTGVNVGPGCGDAVFMPPPPGIDDEPGMFFEFAYGLAITDLFVATGPGVPPPDAEIFAEYDPETETFTEERQERLTLSWFVSGGGPDRNRTAFDAENPDNSNIERAASNIWGVPPAIELDDPNAIYGIFVVVRDGRGGRAFLQRNVRFVALPESAN